jgi:hypothetical protein
MRSELIGFHGLTGSGDAEKEFGGLVAIRNVEDGTNPAENQYSAPAMVRDTTLFYVVNGNVK